MPTYAYRCKSCDHQFEEYQKISEDPLVTCPSCKQNSLVRMIGSAGLVFKGSGFYLTDYKKNGPESKSETAEKKSETPSSDKPATESKPRKSEEK